MRKSVTPLLRVSVGVFLACGELLDRWGETLAIVKVYRRGEYFLDIGGLGYRAAVSS